MEKKEIFAFTLGWLLSGGWGCHTVKSLREWCIQRGFDIGRVQSCVLRLPKYWPPTPLSARRVCPPPATKAGDTLTGRRGGWRVNILEDERHRIVMPSYSNNLSTFVSILRRPRRYSRGWRAPRMPAREAGTPQRWPAFLSRIEATQISCK